MKVKIEKMKMGKLRVELHGPHPNSTPLILVLDPEQVQALMDAIEVAMRTEVFMSCTADRIASLAAGAIEVAMRTEVFILELEL